MTSVLLYPSGQSTSVSISRRVRVTVLFFFGGGLYPTPLPWHKCPIHNASTEKEMSFMKHNLNFSLKWKYFTLGWNMHGSRSENILNNTITVKEQYFILFLFSVPIGIHKVGMRCSQVIYFWHILKIFFQ